MIELKVIVGTNNVLGKGCIISCGAVVDTNAMVGKTVTYASSPRCSTMRSLHRNSVVSGELPSNLTAEQLRYTSVSESGRRRRRSTTSLARIPTRKRMPVSGIEGRSYMLNFAYCVFCFSGNEDKLRRDLKRQLPEATIHYPLLDRQEKKDGRWMTKSYPLIPGYIFVYSDSPITLMEFFRAKRVIRLLGYVGSGEAEGDMTAQKSYALEGDDLEFARWVYENDGHIRTSRAALEGSRVKIVSGPLRYYEGKIKKMDKHKRSALVTVSIGDAEKDVWMAFEWVDVEK